MAEVSMGTLYDMNKNVIVCATIYNKGINTKTVLNLVNEPDDNRIGFGDNNADYIVYVKK